MSGKTDPKPNLAADKHNHFWIKEYADGFDVFRVAFTTGYCHIWRCRCGARKETPAPPRVNSHGKGDA